MLQYMQMKQGADHSRRPFREWLLNLCGYEIWPPTHGDPRIKGPQPRIVTRRQREAIEKQRRGNSSTRYAASSTTCSPTTAICFPRPASAAILPKASRWTNGSGTAFLPSTGWSPSSAKMADYGNNRED